MILITGATGLVGAHLALKLAEEGVHFSAIHQENDPIEKTRALFKMYGKENLFGNINWIVADITDVPSLEIAFKNVQYVYLHNCLLKAIIVSTHHEETLVICAFFVLFKTTMIMFLNRSERIFDTLVDTKRKSVSIKTKFKLREYVLANGLTPIFLDVTGSHERERISMELAVDARYFNFKTLRVGPKAKNQIDTNLILDKIDAKIAEIKIEYRLSDRVLTPSLFRSEYTGGMTRINFVAFFRLALDEDKVNYSKGTYKRYESIYEKLKKFKENIMFSEIDSRWILKYRAYLQKECGNSKTTENGNITTIKKFLKLASKAGVKLSIDLDEIIGGSTKGNRSYLNPKELFRLFDYYNSAFIKDNHKLVLGYFLFSCMTGLRISDLQKIERQDLNNDDVSFINTKTSQDQFMVLNLKAQEIIKNCDLLFLKKYEDQTMNKELKKIMITCGIKKKVSFHVARHTFATCFLRKEVGGNVVHLQTLLKHKNIATTMIYAHIVEAEANEMVFYLDKLFN